MIALLFCVLAQAQNLDDLDAAAARGLATMDRCETAPRTCSGAEVADALYSICLRRHVYMEAPDPEALAALEVLDPARFELLPEELRTAVGTVPEWLSPRRSRDIEPESTEPPLPPNQVEVEVTVYDLGRGWRKADRALETPVHDVLIAARELDVHGLGDVVARPTLVVEESEDARFMVEDSDGVLSLGLSAWRSRKAWQLMLDLEFPGPEPGLVRRSVHTPDSTVFLRRQEDGRQWLLVLDLTLIEIESGDG